MHSPARGRAFSLAGAFALLLLGGCGHDSVTSPHPNLSGPVVLVGFLTDSSGRFTGTKVFADADGVPVELISDTTVVATATTVKGRYTFTDLPAGSYVVRTRVTFDLFAATRAVTIAGFDVTVADTLRLRSRGDLFQYPNPFADTLTSSFAIPFGGPASLRVLNRSGATVRILLAGTFSPGRYNMGWDGTDAHGAALASGFYWLSLQESAGTRDQLLFRR